MALLLPPPLAPPCSSNLPSCDLWPASKSPRPPPKDLQLPAAPTTSPIPDLPAPSL